MTRRTAHYTKRTGSLICEEIAKGRTLKQALTTVGYLAPSETGFWRWIDAHPDFREMYERARQLAADKLADRHLELAEEVMTKPPSAATAYRVAMDALKWHAEMRNRRRWGGKGEEEAPKTMDPQKIKAEIARLQNELGMVEGKGEVVPLKAVKNG